jgi:ATP-dependent Lon protease
MSQPLELPLLPLRDVVVYPHMVIPLFVGRDKSITRAGAGNGFRQAKFCWWRNANASDDDPAMPVICMRSRHGRD